jgi:Rad3-related DNA helicase
LQIHSVTLSARDKMCALEERDCNPLVCPRAKGHFDRVNECLYELLVNEDNISRECIEEYAQAYEVCPYELSLDIAEWVDFVICDYNYLFDPKVQLKRFFSEQAVRGQYVFLVDEAHNLVERGRTMYSAVLSKSVMHTVQTHLLAVSKKTAHTLLQLQETMDSYQNEIEETAGQSYRTITDCDVLSVQLLRFVAQMDEVLDEHAGFAGEDEVMQFYFDVHHFLNMYETLDDHYVIYVSPEGPDDCQIHLFCVNPSKRLSAVMEKGRSTIFFSATLLPIHYYKELLTGNQKDRAVYIPSPFDRKQRFLAIAGGVTSKYSRRGYDMYGEIVEYIRQATVRTGNYMVFFSSYKMMEDVYDVALEHDLDNGRRMMIQQSHMSERERELFLQEFQDTDGRPLIAFCILGGIFSEGIDLKEEQLIGAFIVGTGLPQIGVERDLLNAYFRAQGLDGFAYAYIYPGMNKVMQAAGRVIRTEQDKGVILLMDDRFRQTEYRSLFPKEWEDVQYVDRNTVGTAVRRFWEEVENNPFSS